MVVIQQDHTKTKQLYLFVKSFEWQDAFTRERFAGLPKVGSVYRAHYNEDVKNYKIFVTEEPLNAIMIDSLISFNPEADCLCEFISINRENLLDLDITEEYLDKILNWMKPNIETGLMKLGHEINQQREEDEANHLAMAFEIMSHLYSVDTDRFFIVLNLIAELTDLTIEETEDPAINLTYDPRFASGVNLASALRNIGEYTSENKRTNLETSSLVSAVYDLIREIEQRSFND